MAGKTFDEYMDDKEGSSEAGTRPQTRRASLETGKEKKEAGAQSVIVQEVDVDLERGVPSQATESGETKET